MIVVVHAIVVAGAPLRLEARERAVLAPAPLLADQPVARAYAGAGRLSEIRGARRKASETERVPHLPRRRVRATKRRRRRDVVAAREKKKIKNYAVVATRARPEELHAVGLDLRAPRLVRRRRSRRKKTRAASTVTRRSATIGRVAMASSRFLNCWGRAAHCAQTEQPKTCGDASVRAAVAPTTRIQRTPRPRDQAREPALAAAVGPRRAGQRLGEPARVER